MKYLLAFYEIENIDNKGIDIPRLTNDLIEILKECVIYIYSNLVSKSKPIDYIKNKENIMDYNIYTVGDNINDLEMLRDYNGYAMYHASKDIKEIAGNTCFSVSNLIRKLRR